MAKLTQDQLHQLTQSLDDWGAEYDASGQWPEKSVALVGKMGGWRWAIPAEFGGDPMPSGDLLRVYEAASAGCMSTALICTQRDGAVELIAGSPNEDLKRRLLPRLARGEIYTTLGIAQLNTSKRGGGHLMKAVRDRDGYRLNGMMPWATGAERAAVVVTGAVLPDGSQILAGVPTDLPGLHVDEPAELMTLTASRTSCVHCQDCRVGADDVLRGPAARVLSLGTPVKPLVTSACGIGVAGALQAVIASLKPGLRSYFEEVIGPLSERYHFVREKVFAAADHMDEAGHEIAATEIRIMVNDIVVRMGLAALTLAKGSGFVKGRAVQRHFREALFFLVWSAPAGVQLETLVRLMGTLGQDPEPLADI